MCLGYSQLIGVWRWKGRMIIPRQTCWRHIRGSHSLCRDVWSDVTTPRWGSQFEVERFRDVSTDTQPQRESQTANRPAQRPLVTIISNCLHAIVTIISNCLHALVTIISNCLQAIVTIISNCLHAIVTIISNCLHAIVTDARHSDNHQ